ncbi:hypothetical protein ACFPRL_03840 [Pseudoclavibacter helvolus]
MAEEDGCGGHSEEEECAQRDHHARWPHQAVVARHDGNDASLLAVLEAVDRGNVARLRCGRSVSCWLADEGVAVRGFVQRVSHERVHARQPEQYPQEQEHRDGGTCQHAARSFRSGLHDATSLRSHAHQLPRRVPDHWRQSLCCPRVSRRPVTPIRTLRYESETNVIILLSLPGGSHPGVA